MAWTSALKVSVFVARSRAFTVSDADVVVYEKLRMAFEPRESTTEAPGLTVDGAGELDVQLDRVACALLRAASRAH